MKKLTLFAAAFAFCFFVSTARAQQFDAAFNFSALSAPSSTVTNGVLFPTVGGGLYPGFSADFMITHHIGFEGEINWRGSQFVYGGYEGARPVLYNFNAIWAPRLSKNLTAELVAGIGAEDIRFYPGGYSCSYVFGCTTYVSSNHFDGDFGGGIRAYFWRNAFIRPEARLYLIHNNVEFSSNYAARYGVSIGYSFGGR